MSNLAFNIHNLIKFDINLAGDERWGAGLKYSFFRVENNNDPDITLNIGKFHPSNHDCDVLSHRYYVRDNYFYIKDNGQGAKWELEILGFESGKTIINLRGKGPGLKGIIFPTFLAQEFLIPMIEYRLSQENNFLIHAGAASKGANALIFSGRPGSYKTTLIMDLIRRSSFEFLSDDRIIINRDSILSFPTSLFLFEFMINHIPTEKRNALINIKLLKKIFWNDNEKRVSPLIYSSKQKTLVFISKSNKNSLGVRNINFDEGIKKLLANNKAEYISSFSRTPYSQFFKYALIYSLVFPNNRLVKYWNILEESLENILRRVPMYEIELPYNYNMSVFKRILELLPSDTEVISC